MRTTTFIRLHLTKLQHYQSSKNILKKRNRETQKRQLICCGLHVQPVLVISGSSQTRLSTALNAKFGYIEVVREWTTDVTDAGMGEPATPRRNNQAIAIFAIEEGKKVL